MSQKCCCCELLHQNGLEWAVFVIFQECLGTDIDVISSFLAIGGANLMANHAGTVNGVGTVFVTLCGVILVSSLALNVTYMVFVHDFGVLRSLSVFSMRLVRLNWCGMVATTRGCVAHLSLAIRDFECGVVLFVPPLPRRSVVVWLACIGQTC